MLLLLSLFAVSTQAAIPCSTLWDRGFPQVGGPSTDSCDPFIPTSTTLGAGQEMYFQNATGENETVKRYMNWAAEAFTYSTNKYSAFASVPKIRIVFSEQAYGGSTGSDTRAFTFVEFFHLGREFCPVVLYPRVLEMNKDHFYQMVAHEIYHCVQKVNFPAQTTAVVQGTSEGSFWFESIAQFISNDVYPPNNFEYSSIFGSFDQHVPFFQQANAYLSEGFFQGLFWEMGSSAANVHGIQSRFSSGSASGASDAMTIPNISDAFHKIARKMSFNELRDTSGALAPWTVEKQVFEVPTTASSSFSVPFMDFATEPFEIIFPKRGRYRVNVVRPDGSKLSVRKFGQTTWQSNFDATFDTECDQSRKFEGIFTRASDELALSTARIEISRVDNPTCPCDVDQLPDAVDLLSHWQVQLDTVKDFMRRLVGPAFDINDVSGGVKLTFTERGIHIWDYQNLTIRGKMKTSPAADVVWHWNGVATMKYSNYKSDEGNFVCTRALSNTVTGSVTMTVNGHTTTTQTGAPAFLGEGSTRYEMRGLRYFKYIMNAGPIPLDWVWELQ